MTSPFTDRVVSIIDSIPEGKVLSYGRIAALAESPRAARQVVRILHTQTRKHNLPWHRVVNARGRIALRDALFFEEQKVKLETEGVKVTDNGQVDLGRYLWDIETIPLQKKRQLD